MSSCHHPITDTGDAYLGRLEKKEGNYNGVSGVFQLMNYPPKPTSRKGYFNDKILLHLNEVLDVIQKQASGANSDTVKFVRRRYQHCRDGVGANILGTRNGQIFGHERCVTGAVWSRDDYGVFRQWLLYGTAHTADNLLNHEMVGREFLSGFTIAFTIRSVDRSLSSRVIRPYKLMRNACLSWLGPETSQRNPNLLELV